MSELWAVGIMLRIHSKGHLNSFLSPWDMLGENHMESLVKNSNLLIYNCTLHELCL